MKTFRLHILLYALLAVVLGACSDDDGEKMPLPKVILQDGAIRMNTLSITVVPSNASKCAYAYYATGESALTAQQVLSQGRAIELANEVKIEIPDLNWETRYTLNVAAANDDGEVTSTTLDFIVGKDISAGWTEGANCYIVPTAGTYHFAAKKVSGTPIEKIAKVDWLWSSKVADETAQILLENISYQNGEVYFTATGKKGNVVLAALDAAGKIVWSWHIWCTDEPFSMAHSDGTIFMDRCIGATSASSRDGNQIHGLLYQWGRKDPFYGGSDHEMKGEVEIPFSVAIAETLVNPALSMQWKYVPEACNLETAINNPMSMYFQNDVFNWYLEDDDTLWGKEKTDYDPCPQGYRMPTIEEFDSLKDGLQYVGGHLYKYSWKGYNGLWPGQACREGNTGVYTYGASLMIWSSSPMTDPGKERLVYRVVANADVFTDVRGMGCKAYAQVVRCVSEK